MTKTTFGDTVTSYYSSQSPSVVAGIGSEVIQAACILLPILLISGCYLLWCWRPPVPHLFWGFLCSFVGYNSPTQAPDSTVVNAGSPPSHGTTSSPADVCPICISDMRLPCATSCGHFFCVACFLELWRHDGGRRSVRCPCCRRQVSLIRASFATTPPTVESTLAAADINRYNQVVSAEERGIWQSILDMPIVFRWLVQEIRAGGRSALVAFVDRPILCFLFSTIVYLLAPLDLVPEILFGVFGLLDDLLVMGFFIYYICSKFRQYVL